MEEPPRESRVVPPLTHVAVEAGLSHREMEGGEQRFRNLVEVTSDWVWEVDKNGVYTYVSPRVRELLGYEPEEVVGRTPFDLMPPEEAERVRGAFQEAVASQQPLTALENTNVHKDGRLVVLETSGVPVFGPDHHLQGYHGIDRDITDRKRTEETMRRYTQELARSNRELERFASFVSHDLQEPLRTVDVYLELLDRTNTTKLDANSRAFIAEARGGISRVRQLISDMLAYSRVDTAGHALARTDAATALEIALANLNHSLAESGGTVTHDPLPAVPAHPFQLVQVFQNLVDNSLKFRSTAPPRIHATARDAGTEWEFSVRDNGIGFDAASAGRIFALFQRLHDPLRYPGSGVGLAICKKIVEWHGGRIWAESQPGAGSTFYFTLPKLTDG